MSNRRERKRAVGGDLVLGFIRAARPRGYPARVRPYDFSRGPIHTTSTNAPGYLYFLAILPSPSVARKDVRIYLYLTAPELLLKRKQGELKHFTDGAESKGMFVLISDTPPSQLFRSVKELKSLWKMETCQIKIAIRSSMHFNYRQGESLLFLWPTIGPKAAAVRNCKLTWKKEK